MLGVALGEYFVGRCTGQQTFMSRTFLAAGIDGYPTTDFNPFNTTTPPVQEDLGQGPFYYEAAGAYVTRSPLMYYLWGVAEAEWTGRFGVP